MKPLFLILALTVTLFACGDYEQSEPPCPLLYQTTYPAKGYLKYLSGLHKMSSSGYRSDFGDNELLDGNLELWRKIITNHSPEQLYQRLYGKVFNAEPNYDGHEVTLPALPPVEKEIETYLKLIQANYYGANRETSSGKTWSYSEMRKSWTSEEINDTLLDQLKYHFENEKNEQLKQRYGYQIIKLFHEQNRFPEAFTFYEDNLENKFPENEIFYYTIDRLAGCYYNTGKYETAAFLYLKVFMNSSDIAGSARVSYSMCLDNSSTGEEFITTLEDTIGLIALRGLNAFNYDLSLLDQIFQKKPNHPALEHLFLRLYRNSDSESLRKLYGYAIQYMNSSEILSRDFWRIMAAHITYLEGDVSSAQKLLEKVTDEHFALQVKVLKGIYTVAQWDSVGTEQEEYLVTLFSGENAISKQSGFYGCSNGEIVSQIARIYTEQGDSAQGHILRRMSDRYDLWDTHYEAYLDLKRPAQSLYTFITEPPTPPFSKMLYDIFVGKSDEERNIQLSMLKSEMVYRSMRNGDFAKALSLYDTQSEPYGRAIPIICFSNDLTLYRTVKPDSLFMEPPFSIGQIGDTVSKKEVLETMVKLEKLERHSDRSIRAKAHYIQGNYIYYTNNPRGSRLLPTTTIELAVNHYKEALKLSDDKEFKARIQYMLVACEAEAVRSNGNGRELVVGEQFELLRKNFSDSEFYKLARKECYHFNWYINR